MKRIFLAVGILAVIALLFVSNYIKQNIDELAGKTGGFVDSTRRNAPKTIYSKELTSFYYSFSIHWPTQRFGRETIYTHCTFSLDREEEGARCIGSGYSEWDDNAFDFEFVVPLSTLDDLHRIVDEHRVVLNNGTHRRTIGIPEGLGGEIRIKYASGEGISAYDNAGPVTTDIATVTLYDFFIDLAMEQEQGLIDSGDVDWELYKLLHHRLETADGKRAVVFTKSEAFIYEDGELITQGEYVVIGDELPLQIAGKETRLSPYFYFTWDGEKLIGEEYETEEELFAVD